MLCLVLGCAKAPPEPATPTVRELASHAPGDARGWYLRALVAESRGDADEVDRALAWVVRLDRGSPWAWLARARLLARRGAVDEAIAACREALKRGPELAEARDLLDQLLAAGEADGVGQPEVSPLGGWGAGWPSESARE